MKACILRVPAPIETNPLEYTDAPKPQPTGAQVLIRVRACGVCRTDLHVIEGELPALKSPVIPGHQVVGINQRTGERVGVPGLHRTDGTCEYCRAAKENLCEAAQFTGHTVDGGYAEYIVAPEAFVY